MGALPSLKRAWIAASESQRIERMLAAGRAFLALASLVAISLESTEPNQYARVVYVLLALYALESVGILAMVRSANNSSFKFRLTVHAIDIVWPALISAFTRGPNSPFYLFYVFVLLEAAYRWGMAATLATALITTSLYISQGLLASWHIGPMALVEIKPPFDINSFIMRGIYLLMMGYLLGFLGEEERQLRAEGSRIARIMGKIRAETGMKGALEMIFEEMFDLFRARRAVLAVRDQNSGRAFLWEANKDHLSGAVILASSELEPAQSTEGIFDPPGHVWHMETRKRKKQASGCDVFALDGEGRRLFEVVWSPSEILSGHEPVRSVLGACISYPDEWSGPMLIFNPKLRSGRETAIRFLRTLAIQVGPAVYSVFLTSRLRSRAGAIERARVSRELHDGVIQSMIGIEMEIDVLRRESNLSSSEIAGRLGHIQQIVKEEILNVRELMQQMKPIEMRPSQFIDFLAMTVEKFGRDTGISSRFVSMIEEVTLPGRICDQVARILQEALANIRRHSKATTVMVQLGSQDGRLKIVIDDNGKGFGFSGRFSLAELDMARTGPLTIKERVRSMGGDLFIESVRGQGSRLEIILKQGQHG